MQTSSRASGGSEGVELRILTYNVHSCRGRGGVPDPARIADVIASSEPDVVALQELDVGRMRTGGIDQAQEIARHLRLAAHFHPALHVDEEKYGDAILTALPSRLVKAGPLPSYGEPRGAIWVEIAIDAMRLQVVNTHLGLRQRERMRQARTLAGEDWLGSAACTANPAVLAGDFNAMPRSRAYGILVEGLSKPALTVPTRATFPARFPLLRLDHIFTNGLATVTRQEVIDTPLARRASDHLPLLATIRCLPRQVQSTEPSKKTEPAGVLAAHG
jgi:endonuclease/exonuclease/phosphatase family metal-dependent hydrolase